MWPFVRTDNIRYVPFFLRPGGNVVAHNIRYVPFLVRSFFRGIGLVVIGGLGYVESGQPLPGGVAEDVGWQGHRSSSGRLA